MSFDRFKKAQKEKGNYKEEIVNPYKDFLKKDDAKAPLSSPVIKAEENVLRKEGHEVAQYHALRRELDELRDDIASLYAMMIGVDLSDLDLPNLRTFINHLRMDERHVIHHKKKFKI